MVFVYLRTDFPLFFVLWKMQTSRIHISLIDVSHTTTIESMY